MTLVSMCGIVRDDGRDCPNEVDLAAPLNLCRKHYAEAYEWEARERGTIQIPLPERCELCGAEMGSHSDQGWRCGTCGHLQGTTTSPFQRVMWGRQKPKLAVVYYLRFDSRVKIGTSTNLRGRLQSLPYDELLALELGGLEQERARHQQFAGDRLTGEWFTHSAELATHIRKLRAGVDDPFAQYEFWVRRATA